jgi:hypothetical protein
VEKLNDYELYSLNSSPNIVRVIKSRRLRSAGRTSETLVSYHNNTRPLQPRRLHPEDGGSMDL